MESKLVCALRADLQQAFSLPFFLSVLGASLCFALDNLQDLKFVFSGHMCIQYYYFHAFCFGGVFCQYLLPILAAVPFAASYCDDVNHHILIYKVTRTGLRPYFTSKIFATVLSGGLCICLGGLVFFLILGIWLPVTNELDLFEMQDMPYAAYLAVHSGLPYLVIALFLLLMNGMLWSSAALCVSVFFSNPYVSICSPMIFSFFLVESGRLLHLPMHRRLDLLLCGRSALDSDTVTLLILLGITVIVSLLFGQIFMLYGERRLKNDA